MADANSKNETLVLPSDGLQLIRAVSRREFVKFSAGTAACLYAATITNGCAGSAGSSSLQPTYPIDANPVRTTTRTLSFPMPAKVLVPNSGTGLSPSELPQISQYSKYGYGAYTYGGPLQVKQRYDNMPHGYTNPSPVRLKQFANFFSISDIHITDKEAPNQLIYLQQEDPVNGGPNTSLYSPVMLYTTHVLDAAIQTVNALHRQTPFDFGISLGDTCNSTQYNELRWYIDVIDGKIIHPSSGAHLGESDVDYQKPFQAGGLDKSIPWYQVLGNHDHFLIGSIPVDGDPSLNIRQSYLSGNVWAVGDVVNPNSGIFPCLFDTYAAVKQASFYPGFLDGSTPLGNVKGAGSAATVVPPPTIVADPNRRSLLRSEWIQEFFNSSTLPSGHGLNLVDPSMGSGFACYSFVPKANIPLKVIVLDDTQSENDGSHDIHGHGFLDATRWNWLRSELAAGTAANQFMIIAAHVPIGVGAIGSEVEWWESAKDPNATQQNAVDLTGLVDLLWNTPNLLMWVAGHRHLNTVKAFKYPAWGGPENAFWQVETSSLRDHPQQFRTFEIYLNSDYTISIVTTNVDPAVAEGTPAAKSRAYSIAAEQIVQTNLLANAPNLQKAYGTITVDTMDPSRLQNGSADISIEYGVPKDVPYCASYNAELFKQPTAKMINVLKAQFPG